MKINQESNEYIIEDLDDQTLVIKEDKLASLKYRLDEVSHSVLFDLTKLTLLLGGEPSTLPLAKKVLTLPTVGKHATDVRQRRRLRLRRA